MLVKKIIDVPAVPVQMEGVENVKVRVLFGPQDNVPTFAMRVFDFGPAGHTPFHTHPFEHEVIILDGDISAVTENGETPLTVGQVVMFEPNEKHQFKNTSDSKTAAMICMVPAQFQK